MPTRAIIPNAMISTVSMVLNRFALTDATDTLIFSFNSVPEIKCLIICPTKNKGPKIIPLKNKIIIP